MVQVFIPALMEVTLVKSMEVSVLTEIFQELTRVKCLIWDSFNGIYQKCNFTKAIALTIFDLADSEQETYFIIYLHSKKSRNTGISQDLFTFTKWSNLVTA